MCMTRWMLKAANSLFNFVVVIVLGSMALYAAFALWDNQRIYTTAQQVQEEIIKLKPTQDGEEQPSFAELLAVNPDVCAWITLDGTKIDYPVLQGETNLTYLNHDVYGDFALAGSIYLDTRNSRDFTDSYSLLYGHHMENSSMFGDLDRYKEKAFFAENSTGVLLLPDETYRLTVLACLVVRAGEEEIFNPELWQTEVSGLLTFVKENSLNLREEELKTLEQTERPKLLACSTCSSEFTDARTILLAVMEPCRMADQEEK